MLWTGYRAQGHREKASPSQGVPRISSLVLSNLTAQGHNDREPQESDTTQDTQTILSE